jgi:MFS family permease
VVGSLLVARQGIVAVSWLQAGIAVVAQVVTIAIAQRFLALPARALLAALGPALGAAIVLGAVLLGVHHSISAPWPAVLAGGAIGLPVYLGALHLLAPGLLAQLRAMAFPAATSPEPPGTERESAIAAREVDAMVRPAPVTSYE